MMNIIHLLIRFNLNYFIGYNKITHCCLRSAGQPSLTYLSPLAQKTHKPNYFRKVKKIKKQCTTTLSQQDKNIEILILVRIHH